MGFAIDGSHLYAQRQMAQAAADAAAQAGILSIFDGTSTTGTHGFSTSATFTCTATNDARTPCYYAQTMNGFSFANDVVTVSFPGSVPGVSLAAGYPASLIQVTVRRPVQTTLMHLLGSSLSTIGATGVAAIVSVASPVPILITHPTLSGSFNLSGTGSGPKITICGGPSRSIQVNSSSGGSLTANGNPSVNLSHAGPLDPGNCTTGTGADFGDYGGPASPPFVASLGTKGTFVQPASPIRDPYCATPACDASPSVLPPSAPTVTSSSAGTALAAGSHGCPSGSGGCTLYFPGKYTTDIKVKNQTGVFAPGIYYMYGASLLDQANGIMTMASGLTDSGTGQAVGACCGTSTGWTGNVMFYFTGPSGANGDATGVVSVSANAGSGVMVGSPAASAYKGILFFADHNAAANNYTLDGGGGLQLTGTIYLTNSLSVMLAHPAQYQTLSLQGNPGSSTLITGEIIASAITFGGTPGVIMNLNPAATTLVSQVALVQ